MAGHALDQLQGMAASGYWDDSIGHDRRGEKQGKTDERTIRMKRTNILHRTTTNVLYNSESTGWLSSLHQMNNAPFEL